MLIIDIVDVDKTIGSYHEVDFGLNSQRPSWIAEVGQPSREDVDHRWIAGTCPDIDGLCQVKLISLRTDGLIVSQTIQIPSGQRLQDIAAFTDVAREWRLETMEIVELSDEIMIQSIDQ